MKMFKVSTFDGTAGFIVGNAVDPSTGRETLFTIEQLKKLLLMVHLLVDAIYKSFPGAGYNVLKQ